MRVVCVATLLVLLVAVVVSAGPLGDKQKKLSPLSLLETKTKVGHIHVSYDGNGGFINGNKNPNGICADMIVREKKGGGVLLQPSNHNGVCVSTSDGTPVHYSVYNTKRKISSIVYFKFTPEDIGVGGRIAWPAAGGAINNVWGLANMLHPENHGNAFTPIAPAIGISARGHMAAAGFFHGDKAGATFNFWNVFPSFNTNPGNFDGNTWTKREDAVTRYVRKHNRTVYLAVGVSPDSQGAIPVPGAVAGVGGAYTRANTVDVPEECWGTMYDKQNNLMVGWRCRVAVDPSVATHPNGICKFASVNEITEWTGFDPYPGVAKETACRDNKDPTVFDGANFPALNQKRNNDVFWA